MRVGSIWEQHNSEVHLMWWNLECTKTGMLLKLPATAMQGLRKALSNIYTKKLIHGQNRLGFIITILKINTCVFLQLLNLVFMRCFFTSADWRLVLFGALFIRACQEAISGSQTWCWKIKFNSFFIQSWKLDFLKKFTRAETSTMLVLQSLLQEQWWGENVYDTNHKIIYPLFYHSKYRYLILQQQKFLSV